MSKLCVLYTGELLTKAYLVAENVKDELFKVYQVEKVNKLIEQMKEGIMDIKDSSKIVYDGYIAKICQRLLKLLEGE